MKSRQKKTKIIVAMGASLFLVGMLIVGAYMITYMSRSVGDSPFTEEQIKQMDKELIKQGLPRSQKEAGERNE